MNMKPGSLRRSGVGGLVIFAGFLVLAGSASSRGSCESRMAPAYLKAFKSLPSIREHAPHSQAPFAPQGVLLAPLSQTRFLTPGGIFGYAFTVRHMPRKGLRLNWRASVSVIHLQPDGAEVGREQILERTLRRVKPPGYPDQLGFGVSMPDEPGIYKYQLRIRRLDGTHLGQVEQYVRIMPARWRVELRTRKRYPAGGRVVVRLANRGSVAAHYGEGMVVKVRRGEEWRRSPSFPSRPVKRVAFVLLPGMVSSCEFLAIPESTPAGAYRIERRVTSRSGDSDEILTARFDIG